MGMELNPGAYAIGFSFHESIDSQYHDVDKFLPLQFTPDHTFDLVICGGAVVRKQERASCRENCDAHRLSTSQFALGFE
ncbi:hypothetical protein ColTof4_10857 [Colletotrichum tofieldiae]|nr:hypothetical protein ColTof3_06974 [Colletotrichum tofieldiae]GKT78434.1 hypothetical protein ColTof4_10857 [Colletotrichum tofieldiae]GKT85797.1 hypothetical protein Ct61P_03647 [Colletotrichum tofieldiae]